MDMLVKKLNYKQCLCYFDDPIIHSVDFETHILALEDLFHQLKSANLKLQPKKCTFASDSVVYLGHSITKDGIKPDQDKISALTSIPVPKTVTELKSFMGLVSY